MAWCTHNDKAIWISFDTQDGSLRRVKLCPICGEVSSAEATVPTTATETIMVTRQLLRDMECVCEMYRGLAGKVPGAAQTFLEPGLLFDRTEKEIKLLLSGRVGSKQGAGVRNLDICQSEKTTREDGS